MVNSIGGGHDGSRAANSRRFSSCQHDVKAKIRRVIGELEATEQQRDPIFVAPGDVHVEWDMAIQQLESAMSKTRVAWWSP
jgi:hypothetical protein